MAISIDGYVGWNYTHVTALTAATVIKAGPGIIHGISINTVGTAANVLTLWDNATAASGSSIAIIGTVTPSPALGGLDITFNNGLTIQLATGTAADITIAWK